MHKETLLQHSKAIGRQGQREKEGCWYYTLNYKGEPNHRSPNTFLRQVSERCATKTRLLIFTLVDTEKVRSGHPHCIRLGNGKKISDEQQKCVSLPSSLLNEDRSGKLFYLHIRNNTEVYPFSSKEQQQPSLKNP
jgi:hypothetical protein